MSKTAKKIIRQEWERLKKAFGKLTQPGQPQQPQLVLQPVRNRKY